jgi:hypothetical protein
MKKIFFLFSFLFATTVLYSQIEIKGLLGLNFSSFTNLEDGLSQNTLVGYQAGAGLLIGSTWYVEPGIQWVKTGTETAMDGTDLKIKSELSYLRIPVMAGYRFFGGTENILNLRLFAGPSLNIVTDVSVDSESLESEEYNTAIWGLNAGLGVDVLFLFADINYEWGMSNVFSEEGFDQKNNVLFISVGARFRIGG